MRDLQSLPSSVAHLVSQADDALARADSYDRRGYPEAARDQANFAYSLLAEVVKATAATSPELAVLLMLSQAGKRKITFTDTQHRHLCSRNDRYTFGIRTGHDERNDYETITRTRSVEIE